MDNFRRKLVMTSKDEHIMDFLSNESFGQRKLKSQCNQNICYIIFLLVKSGYPKYSIDNTTNFRSGILFDFLNKLKPLYGIPIITLKWVCRSKCNICKTHYTENDDCYVLPCNNKYRYIYSCYRCCNGFINVSESLLYKFGEKEIYNLYYKLFLIKSYIDIDVFQLICKLTLNL